MSPEDFIALNIGDILDRPDFSPRLRNLVDLIDRIGPDITIRQVAEATGSDPEEWAKLVVSQIILAELRRINDAEDARKGLN